MPTLDEPSAPDRILVLDVVRGLAVLGILVMNVVEFGLPMRAYTNPEPYGGHEGWDLWTWYVQMSLFDGRMRGLFAMLFGAGIWLFAARLERRGRTDATDVLLRRCLWLTVFGMVHRFALQWTGDILYVYGLLGLIAISLRHLRPRTQLLLGILCLLTAIPIEQWRNRPVAALRAQAVEAAALEQRGEPVPAPMQQARERWERRLLPTKADAHRAEIAAIRGGYASVFEYRWDHHHTFQSAFVYYYFFFDVLGCMLLGMALLRLSFFAGTLRTGIYVLFVLLGVGATVSTYGWAATVAARGFSGAELGLHLWHESVHPVERVLGGLGWAAALMLLVRAGRLRWLQQALAAVGRMALSNYVLQTICCSLFFFGYGFGFYGELSRAQTMWVLLAVSVVQVAVSLLWLRRFRFGPLEWLWRSLTWWQRQPLLRSREPAVVAEG